MTRARGGPNEPPPGADWLAGRLAPLFRTEGRAFDARAAEILSRYLALFLPWNARVNLSAARTAEAVVDAHLADGIALLGELPVGAGTVVDVGAGAGFVSVTLAVLRPDLRFVLLEPSAKRYAFLRAVARELPLPNLEPRAERLEEHLARSDRALYDVAISRATWAPAEWLARGSPLVRAGGSALAFEGGRRTELPAGVERVFRPDGRGALLRLRQPDH